MRQEILQNQLVEILESNFPYKAETYTENVPLQLSEEDMFKLWNALGEELGIDLALASEEQRQLLFSACKNGKSLVPKDFGSLLWLMYYAEPHFQ